MRATLLLLVLLCACSDRGSSASSGSSAEPDETSASANKPPFLGGRFCRTDGQKSCWDLDLGKSEATIVLANGNRAPRSLKLSAGTGDVDYEVDAVNGKVQFKIQGPDTVGVRHSNNTTWDTFARAP